SIGKSKTNFGAHRRLASLLIQARYANQLFLHSTEPRWWTATLLKKDLLHGASQCGRCRGGDGLSPHSLGAQLPKKGLLIPNAFPDRSCRPLDRNQRISSAILANSIDGGGAESAVLSLRICQRGVGSLCGEPAVQNSEPHDDSGRLRVLRGDARSDRACTKSEFGCHSYYPWRRTEPSRQ